MPGFVYGLSVCTIARSLRDQLGESAALFTFYLFSLVYFLRLGTYTFQPLLITENFVRGPVGEHLVGLWMYWHVGVFRGVAVGYRLGKSFRLLAAVPLQ